MPQAGARRSTMCQPHAAARDRGSAAGCRRMVTAAIGSQDALAEQVCREADFVAHLAQYYRVRFGEMIDRLNRGPSSAAGDLACLRLCVEAIDVMLSSQNTLARAIRQISTAPPAARMHSSVA